MFAQKTYPLTAGDSFVSDLRFGTPTGTEYAKIGHLTIRSVRTGGADAVFHVRPIRVNDGDAAPSAIDLTSGTADSVILRGTATTSEEIQIGSRFAPGMNNDVFQGNYFTHVMITCVASGSVAIVGQ